MSADLIRLKLKQIRQAAVSAPFEVKALTEEIERILNGTETDADRAEAAEAADLAPTVSLELGPAEGPGPPSGTAVVSKPV
jgi:hypothetical protein